MDILDHQMEDHMHKCRCCFRILVDEHKAVRISKNIEMKFYELTQIELIQSTSYSDTICELCDRDLRNFHSLKKDLSMKQMRYYQMLPPPLTCEKEDLVQHEITIEALDDAVLFHEAVDQPAKETELQGEVFQYHNESTRKNPRKQKIELIRVISNEKEKFQCSECGMALANSVTLRRHVERIHQKIRNYHCDLCAYSGFFKTSLERHMVQHIPEDFRERFNCDECGFVSISAVNISLHKKYEHGKDRRVFICNFQDCKKQFSRPGQLTAHVHLTHEKRKDKVCNICQRTFSTATRLKDHIMNVHSTNSRDFACEFCPKQFATLHQLKNHQIYHDAPKFPCQLGCGKEFFKAVLREGHHKSHLEQKDFACSYPNCDQKYFLKSHLSRHIKSVHEKIKMSCEMCAVKFVRKENYRAHVLNHHQAELPQEELQDLLQRIKQMKPSKSDVLTQF